MSVVKICEADNNFIYKGGGEGRTKGFLPSLSFFFIPFSGVFQLINRSFQHSGALTSS